MTPNELPRRVHAPHEVILEWALIDGETVHATAMVAAIERRPRQRYNLRGHRHHRSLRVAHPARFGPSLDVQIIEIIGPTVHFVVPNYQGERAIRDGVVVARQ